MVDDLAKEALLDYQKQSRLRTRDDAVESILHKVPEWRAQEAKIKALEKSIRELAEKK